jgi:hypothetical protein
VRERAESTRMSEFRRTLPLPPPGRSVGDALEGKNRRTPGAPADKSKAMATPRVPQFAVSPAKDMRKSKPGSRKTPHLGRLDANELPAGSEVAAQDRNAPSWLAKARALSSLLQEIERTGQATPKVQACVERAHAAWNLDGAATRNVARVAHLAQRGHDAIRQTSRAALDSAYTDCARVLHLGLPSAIKKRVQLDSIVEVVRAMRREADGWVAVVEATMVLLGWTEAKRGRGADAIRQALEEFPPESEG